MYDVKSKSVLPFPKAPLLSSPPPPPRELLWKLPYELKSEVLCARKEFDEACSGYTLDAVEFRDFGKGQCKVYFLVFFLIKCFCFFLVGGVLFFATVGKTSSYAWLRREIKQSIWLEN